MADNHMAKSWLVLILVAIAVIALIVIGVVAIL